MGKQKDFALKLFRWLSGKKSGVTVRRNTYPIVGWYIDTPIWKGSHWRVNRISNFDFASCLRALPFLVPPDSILCLADTVWGDRVANILNTISLNMELTRPTNHNLDFDEAYYIPISNEQMAKLVELAENSAEIEIALNLAVFYDNKVILEWIDLPEPPIYISETIERESVFRFAESVGGKYQRIIFCDNRTFIDV